MAGRNSPGTDFESRYFDLLIDRLDKQDARLDQILTQTQKTNGRVTKLENKVFAKITPWYSDSKLLYVAGICLFVFLSIVATVVAAFTGTEFKVPTL